MNGKEKTLDPGTDYTVSYTKNKNPGKAAVKISGIGNYTGTKTLGFLILPKRTGINSIAGGAKAFTVKWTKQAAQTSGYQIQYSTSSSFASGNKIITVDSSKTTSCKIDGLKSKKTYYVRIRTFKTADGKKYCSAWSAKKKIVTK